MSTILDVVASVGRDVDISEAVVGGELERTIEGASTLTLDVHDPHRRLIRSPHMRRAIDLKYQGVWFRLVKVAKSQDTVTLTFEDRDVAYLRQHTRSRKVSRNKMTRAQFVRSLVREVKANRIGFYCPEVNERQPIGKSSEDATPTKRVETDRDASRGKGLASGAELTVKGAAATAEQRRNGQRVLDVADTLKAGPKATKALIEACIVESQMQNLSHGDRDSLGILQVRVSTSGSAAKSKDIEWCVRQFLAKGFYTDPQLGGGGAMAIARRNPTATAGRVAQATQGSGVPDAYDKVADEADVWLDAYGGASGTDSGGTGATGGTRKRYEFTRGQAGKREDSWTAIQRLASEVQWRAFMDAGTLYFVSEDRLLKSRALYTLTEDTEGVHWIDFDIDQGKISAEVRVSCRTALFDLRIGSVVAVRQMGIANGRWLVATVRQDLFATDTEVTLKALTPKLDEPDTTVTSTSTTGGQGDDITATGSLRERIVEVAEASRKSYNSNPQAWFYSQPGAWNTDDPTKPPTRGKRSDCSQWVAAVYKKAGAPAPGPSYTGGIATGNMRVNGRSVPLGQARPGDIILWSNHVELYIGPGGKTIGHGSAPVDYGTATMKGPGQCWRYDFLD